MAQRQENVSVAKPAVGGAISIAPYGTELPTNAKSSLDETKFKNAGYLHEDGITPNEEADTEEIKAFGGDVVLNPQTKHSLSYEYSMIELNEVTFKHYFGDENVEVDGSTGAIKIKRNALERKKCVLVIDLLLSDGRVYREVIPNGKITETGELPYKDSEAIAYKVKFTAYGYGEGNDKSFIYVDTLSNAAKDKLNEALGKDKK